MGQTMGTGNVADDDEESLVFADESEYMERDDKELIVWTQPDGSVGRIEAGDIRALVGYTEQIS